jgi:hypothetical protein
LIPALDLKNFDRSCVSLSVLWLGRLSRRHLLSVVDAEGIVHGACQQPLASKPLKINGLLEIKKEGKAGDTATA